jgi:hypothetical protein
MLADGVIVCDRCGQQSCSIDLLTYDLHVYDESEIKPGPSGCPEGDRGDFVFLDPTGIFGVAHPAHKHWCMHCWNQVTKPYMTVPLRYRVATAWERLIWDHDVVMVPEGDPEVPWHAQPRWNHQAHRFWKSRRSAG